MALFLARGGKFGENENYFLDNGVVCMLWNELADRDLSAVKSQENLKEILSNTYQDSSKGAISNWAFQIWVHVNKMKVGDLVIFPLKSSGKIAIGKVVSDYIFDAKKKPYSHIRKIEWIKKDIPRTAFDQDLLYSFGAFVTFCEIVRNDAEKRVKNMLKTISSKSVDEIEPVSDGEDVKVDLEEASLDQISKLILAKFKGDNLELLVEAILKAKGYFTYRSPKGADRGVDVLAAKGDLGFESPKICVQVKSGESVGRDVVERLSGTIKRVGADFGLLVSWEGFKSTVNKDERQSEFFRIRLWEQKELVEEFLSNYHKLDEEIKSEIPLKQIWVLADDK